MKAHARQMEVNSIFDAEAPSTVRGVLDRDSSQREGYFGEGEVYHISEPPEAWDDLGDDIKLDDQGDPYYDIG